MSKKTAIKAFKSELRKTKVLESYNDLLRLWDTNIEEIDLETQYGTTHCILSGDRQNPPVILFHGVGDNSAVMWILNMKELSKYFYCICIDTIGGPGKSIPNAYFKKGDFDQVRWINEVVEHLNISHFNIVGVSNGAYMAYNYLTHESKKINKVVCLEGGMIIGSPMKAMFRTLLIAFPQILIPNKKNIIAILKKLSSPESDFINQCPEVVDHMVMVMKAHNQKAMFQHKLEQYNQEKGRAVKDQLSFLLGDYKVEYKKEFIDVLEEGGFQYKIIQGAGHGVNHEQPGVVNAEIISFFDKELLQFK